MPRYLSYTRTRTVMDHIMDIIVLPPVEEAMTMNKVSLSRTSNRKTGRDTGIDRSC